MASWRKWADASIAVVKILNLKSQGPCIPHTWMGNDLPVSTWHTLSLHPTLQIPPLTQAAANLQLCSHKAWSLQKKITSPQRSCIFLMTCCVWSMRPSKNTARAYPLRSPVPSVRGSRPTCFAACAGRFGGSHVKLFLGIAPVSDTVFLALPFITCGLG